MANLVSFFKRIRVKQLLIVCMAGVMLFFTQACSGAGAATPSSQTKTGANSQTYVPKGDGVNNAYQGGMNQFSDVDPRSKDLNSAQTKAKALVDNAQSNITSHMDGNSPDLDSESVKDIGKNVKRGAENVSNKTADSASDFVKGTKRGLENIKNNTTDAASNVSDSAQRAARDAKINTQRAADDAGNAVERTIDRID